MMTIFDDFHKKYSISRTLRFQLLPQGKTREHIDKLNLIAQDEKRHEDYKKVKLLIDDFHRFIIEQVLSGPITHAPDLEWRQLADAIVAYRKDHSTVHKLEKLQEEFRKVIGNAFTENESFKKIDKKELFTELLPQFWQTHPISESDQEAVESFDRFTTYFSGYHENRRNIYSPDKPSVSIPWRIVNDNFPKFLGNIEIFQQLQQACPEELKKLEKELKQNHRLGNWQLRDLFSIDFFGQVLSQNGIDFYNTVIAGVSEGAGKKKKQGINEKINLWRQKNPDKKIPFMTQLYKQILSDRKSESFSFELFPDDKSLLNAVKAFHSDAKETIQEIVNLLGRLKTFDATRLHVPASAVQQISHTLFGNWSILRSLITDEAIRASESLNTKKLREKKVNEIEKANFYSLAFLNELISRYELTPDDETTQTNASGPAVSAGAISIFKFWSGVSALRKQILEAYREFQTVAAKEFSTTSPLRGQPDDVERVKKYLDAVQELLHLVKTLVVPPDLDRDLNFYNQLDTLYQTLNNIVPLYNQVRSSLTRKVSEVEKFKLNFENPTLANGWDENKEQDNTCILLRRDGKYYLGILNARNKPKTQDLLDKQGGPRYQKIVYKLLPGPNKMFPKVFFSAKGLQVYNPPASILEGYKKGRHKKGNTFNLKFCHRLINFFKEKIAEHPDWSKFNFQFSDTSTYKDISDFYNEVEKQGYKIDFKNVSAAQIDQWVDEGKLFLFQIYNKDYASGATGAKNLHTLYWEQIFSKENLSDVIFKLDGQAELFFRPVSPNLDKPVIHRVGQKLVNRRLNDADRTPIPENVYTELLAFYNKRISKTKLSPEAINLINRNLVGVRSVPYDIIKDRRYTMPQFQFHVKIKINFKAPRSLSGFNFNVLNVLKDNPNVHIIGLDRGERNLIYLTLINQKGKIVIQKSFNVVGENQQKTDYERLLAEKQKYRDEKRKSWQAIGKIRELKEGYVSQVIHEIIQLMIKYNAIVVMEDLNFGFKRGRFHVEKQVYQKFELALISKLNYLVFKDRKPGQPGGVRRGYQLTPELQQVDKIGRQCGFLFYVPAGYTSKIDPTTGFVNLLQFHDQVEKAQELYRNMNKIRYNSRRDYFEFQFDYKNFVKHTDAESSPWTVCTYGTHRIMGRKDKRTNQWIPESINVTQQIKKLFTDYKIDFQSGSDLRAAITSRTESAFFKRLNGLLKLTVQMRYSNSQTGEDFILSPVAYNEQKGLFFQTSGNPNDKLPADADANGAYHIALKGLWLVQHGITEEGDKISLASLSNSVWFQYARSRNEKF
ncbi:MAG: type V CRISPR-associated protein Cas12a/Cpf1 [Planctomycetia bacterium]|nr:type V CRISPR-associated protein Cas12a/Cpf1 [Planctomycetia bacterium]